MLNIYLLFLLLFIFIFKILLTRPTSLPPQLLTVLLIYFILLLFFIDFYYFSIVTFQNYKPIYGSCIVFNDFINFTLMQTMLAPAMHTLTNNKHNQHSQIPHYLLNYLCANNSISSKIQQENFHSKNLKIDALERMFHATFYFSYNCTTSFAIRNYHVALIITSNELVYK